MGHAKMGGLQHAPFYHVAQPLKLSDEVSPIRIKLAGSKPWDVFEEYRMRSSLADEPERLRKQITLVGRAMLLARDGKRWTGYSTRDEINAAKIAAINLPQIALDDLQVWPVLPKRPAGKLIIINGGNRHEARCL